MSDEYNRHRVVLPTQCKMHHIVKSGTTAKRLTKRITRDSFCFFRYMYVHVHILLQFLRCDSIFKQRVHDRVFKDIDRVLRSLDTTNARWRALSFRSNPYNGRRARGEEQKGGGRDKRAIDDALCWLRWYRTNRGLLSRTSVDESFRKTQNKSAMLENKGELGFFCFFNVYNVNNTRYDLN